MCEASPRKKGGEAIMNAWLWAANPMKKWTGVSEKPGMTPFGALEQYLGHNGGARYVYWATPAFRTQMRVGDAAYIWLSGGGIIAAGTIAEKPPHEYRPGHNENKFDHPERLRAAGWNEGEATSGWKIGIEIAQFWRCARPLSVQTNLFTLGSSANATVFRLDEDQQRSIVQAVEAHIS
jgi:hypothetical protein